MSVNDYEWLVLESDEEILWSGEPELFGYAWLFAMGIVLIPMFGIGFVIIALTYLSLKNTAYVITTESVFKKTGILSRKITDIGHENIQDTGYKQGIVGRYYEFGTVQISTAGGSGVEMSLAYVPDPLNVQSQLDAVATRRSSAEDTSAPDAHERVEIMGATLDELITEMRATREALESIEERLSED
ncbi:PH domain-containing protein [Natronosalvus halobius]|uniref:PH domain-containing protein n=1 Tax=Natronosalvus halobius TaxID=2953746 RepID=UPI0020A0F872|nr:PH domain-containing protein [Natronosalvus halobius]USZ73540.1 PH domain-containing protein [Natronosalvus halobius]